MSYIIKGEPGQKKTAYAWQTAIGLQYVTCNKKTFNQ